MNNYVKFFDTTLRDGEQSPGATMTSAEKLDIARALTRMGVDIIEAGFPAASPDDLEAVRSIAIDVGNPPQSKNGVSVPVIAGLARANKSDIDQAWEAIKYAQKPRIHTFLATSRIHMKHKLKMDPEEVVQRTSEMTAYARSLCEDIEFSPEDASRSDLEFLYLILGEAIKAGARTLNIPDTVGYATPEEYFSLIEAIIKNTPGMNQGITVSVHCHDDLGLATANALAGIRAGARQVEVTVNGIGERAGNTSLEEVAMTLKTRKSKYNLETGIETQQLARISKLVSNYTGITVQPNKAIVGANAFAHEAGIHQDGMLKHTLTYEILRPEDVGVNQTNLVLGKHSGRHALRSHLIEMGYSLNETELEQVFVRFKSLADRKKVITEPDLEALIVDEFHRPPEYYQLEDLQVSCGTLGMPTATVRLRGPDSKVYTHAALGTGPIDAAYKAIDEIIKIPSKLLDFNIHAITEGIDALGEVIVRIQSNNNHHGLGSWNEEKAAHVYGGHGADTDIIVASAKAYIIALNKLIHAQTEEPNLLT